MNTIKGEKEIQYRDLMNTRWDKACGVDVHKRFIDATILTSDGTKKHRRFLTNIEGSISQEIRMKSLE